MYNPNKAPTEQPKIFSIFSTKFLSSNILQIEKYLKRFIKKIILIIDHEEPFKIKLSLKKKSYGNSLNDKSLALLLKDARSQIKENYDDKVIAHMIIDKYLVDENSFTSLPDNVKFDKSFINNKNK